MKRLLWRGVLLAAITAAGLLSLVGSGGGVGFPPCDAPWCDDPPPTPLPSAHMDPPYRTAQVGSTVTFSVATSDLPGTLSYAWSRSSDGVSYAPIAGESTSRLTLSAVNLADDGTIFRVLVRSSSSQSAAASARLLVNASPGIVLRDGDFSTGSWRAFARENPSGVLPAHVETVPSTGGTPGAWLQMQFQIPWGAGSAAVLYLRDDARYDPRVQGAVRVIDYAEDCRTVVPSDLVYAESHLAFEQAGRRYSAIVSNVCKSSSWSAVPSRASLAAADFTRIEGPACAAGEACPDFLGSAPPLVFGFRRFVWGAPGDSLGHGIDNWTVTVWRR